MKPAAPVFRKAHTDNLQFRRKTAKEHIRSRMEAQQRRDQVHERRSGLKMEPREISIARKITLRQMATYSKPIVGGLQRQMKMLVGLELENGKPSVPIDRKQIQDPALTIGVGEDL